VDIKDFLDELEKTSDNSIAVVHVPSIKKDIEFGMFNVNQQKQQLKTAFEGVVGVINSNILYNEFLVDNCAEPVDFNIVDRPSIIINLRKLSLNDNITIQDKDYSLNELGNIDYSNFTETRAVTCDNIICNLGIPSLTTDTSICKRLVAELNKLSDEQQKTESVSLLLTYEIIKFVQSIEIGETVLDFNDISVYEKKNIIEKLPLKLNNNILDYIVDIKTKCNEYLTFEDGTLLEIDASLLSSD
tara:strand:- start:27030 stop:27761 length:732 start_codon:yes stop_codon:yes gene_type:complete